ncbi:hypothetical protein RDI58_020016 [Solanum bulbocastanum]|uniref:Uncharacterized protein n=1 Tax=Solanum bulbocastanum TaxID=147425 RepID=A0AAN8T7X3_SOLBU
MEPCLVVKLLVKKDIVSKKVPKKPKVVLKHTESVSADPIKTTSKDSDIPRASEVEVQVWKKELRKETINNPNGIGSKSDDHEFELDDNFMPSLNSIKSIIAPQSTIIAEHTAPQSTIIADHITTVIDQTTIDVHAGTSEEIIMHN